MKSILNPEPKAVDLTHWFKYLQGCKALVTLSRYNDSGRVCIVLNAAEANEQMNLQKSEVMAVLSVNLPQVVDLRKDEVLIKSYSENDGAMNFLVDNGIIGPEKAKITAGFAEVTRHDILVGDIDAWNARAFKIIDGTDHVDPCV